MAFQRVPETAEIIVRYTLPSGVSAVNTFYARRSGGYSQAQLDALADAVDQWVQDEIRPLLDTGTLYVRTDVTGLDAINDLTSVASGGAGGGAVAGTDIANMVSFAVKRVSGLTGRNARGRIYWPSLSSVQLQADINRILATVADDIEDALNLLRAIITILGWVEVIVSRYLNGTKRAEAVTFPVAGYVYGDLILDTQRRRRPT